MIQLLPLPYVPFRSRTRSRSSDITHSPQWSGIVLFFLLTVFTTSSSNAQTKKLTILSTIKPIQLLVNDIVGQHATSTLLISARMNLHNYSLRPSDLRKIAHADMVIRISENMETFLNSLFDQNKPVISLSHAAGIAWLPVRGSHNHSASNHGDNHSAEQHHRAHHSTNDYHIWLDPNQVTLLADYITQKLSLIDPKHAENYSKNNEQLKQEIYHAHRVAQSKLQPLKGKPYLVFHDSWHYFERAYGLSEPHVISLQEGLPPGLKTIYQLRKSIKALNIKCLIVAPNNNKNIIQTITENLPIKTIELSPNGMTKTKAGISSYSAFIHYNAKQFSQCLDSN